MTARRSVIEYSSGSAEMQANGLYEGIFREWLIEYLGKHSAVIKKDALNSGAEITGGSPATMGRYLDKLTSAVGPLLLTRNEAGITVVMKKGSGA